MYLYSLLKSLSIFVSFVQEFVRGNPDSSIDCAGTKLWGPGIQPEDINTPARYFFLQTFYNNGSMLNKSPGKQLFDVLVYGREDHCRIRTDFLDRKDGSFIVRYKLYSPCPHLRISIKCLGQHVGKSPYDFKETVYPHECACTFQENVENWFQKYGLNVSLKRYDSNLKYFKEINIDKIFQVMEATLLKNNKHCVCNYVIKNNEIYRKCYGPYTGFKMFMDSILLFLSRQIRIPDVEFFMNLGDWPLIKDKVHYNGEKILLPMFSWCGSTDSYDIIFPTYDLTESSLENMGRVTLDILSVQGNSGPRWENKIPKLFWRGRDSSRERLKFIEIARQNKDLINASLTNFFFFKDLEHQYGPAEPRVSFFSFFDFKYQLNLDGTVAAYRLPYLLAGNSLVFKQDSSYYEFFYPDLKKWIHYIPVKEDLSNLIEKLQWAINHESEAYKIAMNGQGFVNEFLLPHHVFLYHGYLLNAYSQKLNTSQIKVRPGMELVKDEQNVKCNCPNLKSDTSLNPRTEHTEL